MSDEFDFGFTAVDEEELGLATPAPTQPTVTTDAVSELNAKLVQIQTAISNITPSSQEAITAVEATKAECKAKLQAVEKLILPLLVNLMKNPEKPYIKWENRTERITSQIDKITAITRSYGV